MLNKFVGKLLVVALISLPSVVLAAPPPEGQGAPAVSVSTTDNTVVQAANFAAKQISGRKATKVIQAQRKGKDGEIYEMQIEVVGSNGSRQVYNVEVCAPSTEPWKVQSSTQVQ